MYKGVNFSYIICIDWEAKMLENPDWSKEDMLDLPVMSMSDLKGKVVQMTGEESFSEMVSKFEEEAK